MTGSTGTVAHELTTTGGGRLDVSGARRRQTILAVRQVIANEGVGAVTIARIAEVMGTSRGVVNYHFANKDEIVREALQSAVKDASEATDQAVSEADDLESIVRLVVGLASSDSDWWKIYAAFLAEAVHDEFAREMIRATDRSFRENLATTLGNPARAAIVLALMKGLALQRLVDEEFDVNTALDASADLLVSWHG